MTKIEQSPATGYTYLSLDELSEAGWVGGGGGSKARLKHATYMEELLRVLGF